MMVVVVHQMRHCTSAGPGSHARPEQRRLFLETMHSRLHRLVQTEHHRFRFRLSTGSSKRTIDDAHGPILADVLFRRTRGDGADRNDLQSAEFRYESNDNCFRFGSVSYRQTSAVCLHDSYNRRLRLPVLV